MNFRMMLATFLVLSLCLQSLPAQEAEEKPKPKPIPDQATLEKQFSELLTGSVLVGKFTIDGKLDNPKVERYEISKATKVSGDDWLVQAVVKFGETNVNVPIKLQIRWAGDTPVMILDDLTIPGLGTFTSRTLFHGNRYVGTWQHGEIGGHMYGSVEKAMPKQPASGTK